MESTAIRIPNELFNPAECAHYEGVFELPVIKVGPDLYTLDAPVSWQVDITNTGDAFLVMGTAEADASTSCGRCLETVTFPLIGEIEGYFVFSVSGEAPDDMEEDEFDVLPESNIIDLAPLIVTALRLEVPVVPLCSDDCKGICPQCGANLNEGPCQCPEDEDDAEAGNPFAALKKLTFDDE